MKKKFLLIAGLLSVSIGFAQPAVQWQKNYGGSQRDEIGNFDNDYDGADHCIVVLPDGGFAFTGASMSDDNDVTGNHGGRDFMAVRCDSSGNVIWSKLLGGPGEDYATSILHMADGGFAVIGYSNSNDTAFIANIGSGSNDIVIARLDSLGNTLWVKNYGGTDEDRSYSFAETAEGGFMVSGVTSSDDSMVSGFRGYSDFWVFKTDNTGILIWEHTYGGSSLDWSNSLFLTSDQGAIVGGFSHSTDSGIVQHGSGDYYAVRIDSNGTMLWQNTFGGMNSDWGTGITATSDGGFAMTGISISSDSLVPDHHGNRDAYVVKFDSNGQQQWAKSVGGTNYEDGYDVFEDADGNLIAIGAVMSSDGDYIGNWGWWDYSVIKLNMTTGEKMWVSTYGGSSADYAITMIPCGNGGYLVAGNSKSSDYNVGGNYGDWDMWILKLTDNYNSISGHYFIDSNSDGLYDSGDQALSGKFVTDTINHLYGFTDSTGYYEMQVADTGSFTYFPSGVQYYSTTPATRTSVFSVLNLADTAMDFVAAPIPGIIDLQVSLLAMNRFRPGFPLSYQIDYGNIGTTTDTGTIVMLLDSNLTFISASITPDLISGDTLIWYVGTIDPLTTSVITVNTTIDSSTPIGTNIFTSVSIHNGVGNSDMNQIDNYAEWSDLTTGSFDPNDKAVSISKIFTDQLANIPYLDYMIRFQNTGNDTAFTVVVRDTISDLLDFSTFSLVGSSHTATVEFEQITRTLTFTFTNILLADSNINESMSHGYIHFRIRPYPNLFNGDHIDNTAGIYFDFNQPVITNTVITQILLPNRITKPDVFNFSVYPNPATSQIRVGLPSEYSTGKAIVQIINSSGKIVSLKNTNLNGSNFILNIANLPSGTYYIRIELGGKVSSTKFIKQ